MTARYALLGHPVAHSLSPAMHTHWFARHGIDATYEAREIPPDCTDLAPHLADLVGANLTVPFKQVVFGLLDHAEPMALLCKSVNTVWRDGDRLCGETTDADGFVDGLLAHRAVDPDRPVTLLGAGGAGIAVAAGLAHRGWTHITLRNRTTARAGAAAALLSRHFPRAHFTAGPLEGFDPTDLGLVAVCVSGPGRAAVRALSIEGLPDDAVWCDLNYWDADPPHRAELSGRFLGGLPMLAHQAARSFHRWTGVRPDADDLPEAVRRAAVC